MTAVAALWLMFALSPEYEYYAPFGVTLDGYPRHLAHEFEMATYSEWVEPVEPEATPSLPMPAPPPVVSRDWQPLVAMYFQPGDVEWALRIIACESGGNPNATNSSSGAAGLFQHLPRYWPERAAAAGWAGADIYDPAANIAVAAWLYYHGGGASHWVCKA